MSKRPTYKEQDAARDAVVAINPDDSDKTIARIVADYLLTASSRPLYHLRIFHDVRPSAQRKIEKIRERRPDYQPCDPVGPCPLPFDWSYKNSVGISTRDRERARQWIIDGLLAGYGVFRGWRRHGSGFGQGSLDQIRARRREQINNEARRLAGGSPP